MMAWRRRAFGRSERHHISSFGWLSLPLFVHERVLLLAYQCLEPALTLAQPVRVVERRLATLPAPERWPKRRAPRAVVLISRGRPLRIV
jgi:hypothetical protein